MKKLLLLLLFIPLFASSQTWTPVLMQVQPNEGSGTHLTWSVTYHGDTIAQFGPFPPTSGQTYVANFFVPQDCFTLNLNSSTSAGLGNGGNFYLVNLSTTEIIAYTPVDGFTDEYHVEICLCPTCEPNVFCSGDLDGNGVVNVNDLSIFLSNFGTICQN